MPDNLRRFNANLFHGLAHPTRIAIVETLRDGELPAGAIVQRLGLEQANASQHFAVLRTKGVVRSRRLGNQVLYSIRDSRLIQVLDLLRQYFNRQLSETSAMLKEASLEAGGGQ